MGSRHVPLTLRTDTNPPKKLVSVSVAECNSALRGNVTPTPDTEEELGGWSGGTGGGSGGRRGVSGEDTITDPLGEVGWL